MQVLLVDSEEDIEGWIWVQLSLRFIVDCIQFSSLLYIRYDLSTTCLTLVGLTESTVSDRQCQKLYLVLTSALACELIVIASLL